MLVLLCTYLYYSDWKLQRYIDTFLRHLLYKVPEPNDTDSEIRLKIKHNDWLPADTCPQAANHCALF